MHTNQKLFMISGPPGSGKSTLAKAMTLHFSKSIHIECDSLYNMVQGGHKKPWEQGADTLISLMQDVLVSQSLIYLRAGFVVVADYVWSPREMLTLFNQIGSENIFYPVFLLPEKSVNLKRNLDREHPVDSGRVLECREDFETWKSEWPQLFFDNSRISATEISEIIARGQGYNYEM